MDVVPSGPARDVPGRGGRARETERVRREQLVQPPRRHAEPRTRGAHHKDRVQLVDEAQNELARRAVEDLRGARHGGGAGQKLGATRHLSKTTQKANVPTATGRQ